jgi:hypothetical protein
MVTKLITSFPYRVISASFIHLHGCSHLIAHCSFVCLVMCFTSHSSPAARFVMSFLYRPKIFLSEAGSGSVWQWKTFNMASSKKPKLFIKLQLQKSKGKRLSS